MSATTKIAMRVDWFRVIVDLERAGMSHVRIADAVGISQARIQAYKNGLGEPKHRVGSGLVTLWVRHGGDPLAVPQEKW